jgi:hypothetical protein
MHKPIFPAVASHQKYRIVQSVFQLPFNTDFIQVFFLLLQISTRCWMRMMVQSSFGTKIGISYPLEILINYPMFTNTKLHLIWCRRRTRIERMIIVANDGVLFWVFWRGNGPCEVCQNSVAISQLVENQRRNTKASVITHNYRDRHRHRVIIEARQKWNENHPRIYFSNFA